MKQYTATVIYKCVSELGEGALWDYYTKRLWWVDIMQGAVHRFDPSNGVDDVFVLGGFVSTVVPVSEKIILITRGTQIITYNLDTKETQVLHTIQTSNKSVRFNDGKCDPAGRFWVGTMAQDGSPCQGGLYCLETDGKILVKMKGVSISNGIGWNPAGTRMYYIDSPTQMVREFVYSVHDGTYSNERIAFTFDVAEGVPDGLCVDKEGMLWIALWDGGKVVQVNPVSGERMCEIVVPGVKKVTSCALGGENMDTIFITTARQGLTEAGKEKEPDAGSLFACNVEVAGIPSYPYKL